MPFTCLNAPGDGDKNDSVPLLECPLGAALPGPEVHTQDLRLTQLLQLLGRLIHISRYGTLYPVSRVSGGRVVSRLLPVWETVCLPTLNAGCVGFY